MEVILLERVRNLGSLGDKVNVKPGFAFNFLIPQHKAVPADEENTRLFEERRAEFEAKAADELSKAQQRADALSKLGVRIEVLASDEGKLYGSVGPNEIASAFTKAGETVFKREVDMPNGPIHEVGEHEVIIRLHSDVEATLMVTVGTEA